MQYNRISADCHLDMIWLPHDLFTSEASAALKDQMPHVVVREHIRRQLQRHLVLPRLVERQR